METTKEFIKKYIQNMEQISVLSLPNFESDVNVDDYTKILHENFVRIGKLASENREILDTYVFPILNAKELTRENKEILREAFVALVDGYTMENVDISLAVLISDKLLEDALNHCEDTEQLIQALDDNILANYNMMNVAKRTSAYSSFCKKVREKAFRSSRMLLSYLEPDQFVQLRSDTAIDSVLVNARYISALYENLRGDSAFNRENYEILCKAYDISESPFYRERVPEYDWNYYKLRTCEYFGMTLELHNQRGFEQKYCKTAKEYCDILKELWNKNPEENREIISEGELCLLSCRADYLSGNLSVQEYKDILSTLYNKRNSRSFSMNDIFMNVLLPVEYIRLLANRSLSEKEKNILDEFYHNATNYVLQLPNQDTLNFLLEYFCALLSSYIEVPGGMSFEELGLSCLAAFHPPTFVHTMMVGKIAACLCGHLLRLHPEVFAGVAGYDGKEELTEEKRYEIIQFTYQGALCHDFGKLFIMDIIAIYGRKIMDDEFEMIKCHSDLGSDLLLRCESTRRYANIARGHHKWYDNSKGYPEEFRTDSVAEKVVIDLVTVADCLDAATDTVGRSYSRGKTLADMKDELTRDAGTRYTPFITELMEDETVLADLEFILSQYREKMYRDTYVRLQKVSEREKR